MGWQTDLADALRRSIAIPLQQSVGHSQKALDQKEPIHQGPAIPHEMTCSPQRPSPWALRTGREAPILLANWIGPWSLSAFLALNKVTRNKAAHMSTDIGQQKIPIHPNSPTLPDIAAKDTKYFATIASTPKRRGASKHRTAPRWFSRSDNAAQASWALRSRQRTSRGVEDDTTRQRLNTLCNCSDIHPQADVTKMMGICDSETARFIGICTSFLTAFPTSATKVNAASFAAVSSLACELSHISCGWARWSRLAQCIKRNTAQSRLCRLLNRSINIHQIGHDGHHLL